MHNQEITVDKLLQTTKQDLLQQQRDLKQQQQEHEVAIKAIEMLEHISRVIQEARQNDIGPGVFEIGRFKVGELALILARNNIKLTLAYEGVSWGDPTFNSPDKPRPTEVYDDSDLKLHSKKREVAVEAANEFVDRLYRGEVQFDTNRGTQVGDHISIPLISTPAKAGQVKTTNGYCDTCGDMWVRGYDSHHPTCQRWEGE